MVQSLKSLFSRQSWFSIFAALFVVVATAHIAFGATGWEAAWPKTDFKKHSVPLDEISSGGPGKDGIPAIDDPEFKPLSEIPEQHVPADTEPVITLKIDGKGRAYPLRILMWHEIVNDRFGGVPVAVTYCPLCNSAIVFDRRVGGRVLDFGATGNLRNSDLVMYDRQTESWWQQFIGEAIVGEMTGTRLKAIPARVESFARFKKRFPKGDVLVPPKGVWRAYGVNPYEKYDSSFRPFLYRGKMPEGIAPLAYVLVVGKEAWTLDLIRKSGRIEKDELVITWSPGQNSALDSGQIATGRDIGNIVVQRKTGSGLVDAVHDLTFAFTFHALHPDGMLHK